MIHNFKSSIEGIAIPEKFTCPFCYVPHILCIKAAEEVQNYLVGQLQREGKLAEENLLWADELAEGKMFGVLVIRTATGETGYLAAYSGNLGHSCKYDFFVPPVFDLLDPEGFFVKEEKQISNINEEIDIIREDITYSALKKQLAEEISLSEQVLKEAKGNIKLAKAERDKRRKENPDEKSLSEMIRESQFLKAGFKRLECSLKERMGLLREQVNVYEGKISALSEERKARSYVLQRRLFDSFRVLNARGEEQGLYDIFKKAVGRMPPAGAGDCAAPKLLQYAYKHKMQPLAMAEFWWKKEGSFPGFSPEEEGREFISENEFFSDDVVPVDYGLRRHGYFYPACKSKCEPILNFMTQGLDVEDNCLNNNFANGITVKNRESVVGNGKADTSSCVLEVIFEDEWFVVVNKPAGMLSVPGKGDRDSVYSIMKRCYPYASGPLIVHRLDMDTSGLMIITKTKDAHKKMQKLFASGQVEKCYVAILDGTVNSCQGEISLPLCLDPDDRPRQIVSYKYGKPAVTRYKVLKRPEKGIAFFPLTGRTHQIRVHAAHPDGLNTPIKGDRLYGRPSYRLYLHAKSLKFIHPITGKDIFVEKDADF